MKKKILIILSIPIIALILYYLFCLIWIATHKEQYSYLDELSISEAIDNGLLYVDIPYSFQDQITVYSGIKDQELHLRIDNLSNKKLTLLIHVESNLFKDGDYTQSLTIKPSKNEIYSEIISIPIIDDITVLNDYYLIVTTEDETHSIPITIVQPKKFSINVDESYQFVKNLAYYKSVEVKIKDPSIAKYSKGFIIGLKEGITQFETIDNYGHYYSILEVY